MNNLGKNIFSQNGEDGILEEIVINRLKISPVTFVEFGAWDGQRFSNTRNFLEREDSYGVMIEKDDGRFAHLCENMKKFGSRVECVHKCVCSTGENGLDGILSKTRVPRDFSVLSIDVDGPDYWIWNGMTDYAPAVVVIEIESSFPPDRDYFHGHGVIGTSFRSMVRLGRAKGYSPVCHTGNVIFVRSDLADGMPEATFLERWRHNF